MVKKIKIIEEEKTLEELTTISFQEKLLEYLQAIDWKLWELMKIEQARDKKNDNNIGDKE